MERIWDMENSVASLGVICGRLKNMKIITNVLEQDVKHCAAQLRLEVQKLKSQPELSYHEVELEWLENGFNIGEDGIVQKSLRRISKEELAHFKVPLHIEFYVEQNKPKKEVVENELPKVTNNSPVIFLEPFDEQDNEAWRHLEFISDVSEESYLSALVKDASPGNPHAKPAKKERIETECVEQEHIEPERVEPERIETACTETASAETASAEVAALPAIQEPPESPKRSGASWELKIDWQVKGKRRDKRNKKRILVSNAQPLYKD